jgi:hypothetical protein
MQPTWCGRTPRAHRSSTTLRNRHERDLCRMPTPARSALARCGPGLSPGRSTTMSSRVAVAGWWNARVRARSPQGGTIRQNVYVVQSRHRTTVTTATRP